MTNETETKRGRGRPRKLVSERQRVVVSASLMPDEVERMKEITELYGIGQSDMLRFSINNSWLMLLKPEQLETLKTYVVGK
jgi:hypothetical protein